MADKVDLGDAYRIVTELVLDIPYEKLRILNEVLYDLANDQYVKGMDDATRIHDKYK
jgi:hypothetical protein